MTVQQVRAALNDAREQGVREYYFTGGEPFLHPGIKELITMALAQGPLTLLTNGILIDDALAAWLGETFRRSAYSLDLRVSLDGRIAEENDRVHGRGTFKQIIAGRLQTSISLSTSFVFRAFCLVLAHSLLLTFLGRQLVRPRGVES